jgi:uncharacterized protein (UPF0335 family)
MSDAKSLDYWQEQSGAYLDTINRLEEEREQLRAALKRMARVVEKHAELWPEAGMHEAKWILREEGDDDAEA